MNTPAPAPNPAPPSGTTVTIGSLVAGFVSYLAAIAASHFHLPTEFVSAGLSLLSAAGMSWLHKQFPGLPT